MHKVMAIATTGDFALIPFGWDTVRSPTVRTGGAR